MLEAIRQLAPLIAERSPEIEAGRRVPADLLDQLTSAGCFAMFRPAGYAGIGADLPTRLRVIESLRGPTRPSPGS